MDWSSHDLDVAKSAGYYHPCDAGQAITMHKLPLRNPCGKPATRLFAFWGIERPESIGYMCDDCFAKCTMPVWSSNQEHLRRIKYG